MRYLEQTICEKHFYSQEKQVEKEGPGTKREARKCISRKGGFNLGSKSGRGPRNTLEWLRPCVCAREAPSLMTPISTRILRSSSPSW